MWIRIRNEIIKKKNRTKMIGMRKERKEEQKRATR